MIHKISTENMMSKFNDAQNSLATVRSDISTLRANISNNMKIWSNVSEYMLKSIVDLQDRERDGNKPNRIVLVNADELYGEYDTYGMCVHPKLTKTPKNIFNYIGSRGAIFKNNMTVAINDIVDESYKNMLMHDTIISQKGSVYEFDSNSLTISIIINDIGLGDTTTNAIEIEPYMYGSFDIENINIYEYNGGDGELTQQISNIKNVAPCRIILSESAKIYRIDMNIKLHFVNSNGKYAFGLKHLYLLKCSFVKDSHIIVKIPSNEYISYVYNDISINTQYGDIDTEITSEGGSVYRDYSNGVLSHEINISTKLDQQYISSNIKHVYLRLPVTTSLFSLKPTMSTKEL